MEREDLCGHIRKVGPYLEKRLATLADLPIVGDVRGSHFMMCVENLTNKETKELFPAEVKVGNRIAAACQKREFLVRPVGHLNVLSPPLVLTEEQIDFMVETLREAIVEVADDLTREGYTIS